MKRSNKLLLIGFVGFIITVFIHLGLKWTSGATFDFMLAFYIPWMVFIIIGLGKYARDVLK